MKRYTYEDFIEEFKDEKACLDALFYVRYRKLTVCPRCNQAFKYYYMKNTKYYKCKCGNKISPMANTFLNKTTTKLTTWFLTIFLIAQSEKKVTAKEIQFRTGLSYKGAMNISKKIKILFEKVHFSQITGMKDEDCKIGQYIIDKFRQGMTI